MPPRPLRCAIVPPAPAPYREPLFRALNRRPDLDLTLIYQSAVATSWDAPAGWFAAERCYPVHCLSSRQRARPGRTPIVWPRGLEGALRDADPDCVVVSEYGAASLRGLAWCRLHARAYLIFTECTPQIDLMLSPAQLWLHRRLARHADGVIVVSSAARERLRSFGVPDEQIAVSLQSADVERFRPAASGAARSQTGPAAPPEATRFQAGSSVGETASGAEPLIILSVGRLVPDKNFVTLLHACARSALTPSQAQIQIVGQGFLAAELKQLAARLELPVRFLGHVSPQELVRLYASADICALVSTYEPFGVTIREAAAAGLPIICSRVAGAAGDVAIDGRNAILVDPESVEQIAAAIARLAADPGLRARMGAESTAIDAETDGRDVKAFSDAVTAAVARRKRPTDAIAWMRGKRRL